MKPMWSYYMSTRDANVIELHISSRISSHLLWTGMSYSRAPHVVLSNDTSLTPFDAFFIVVRGIMLKVFWTVLIAIPVPQTTTRFPCDLWTLLQNQQPSTEKQPWAHSSHAARTSRSSIWTPPTPHLHIPPMGKRVPKTTHQPHPSSI